MRKKIEAFFLRLKTAVRLNPVEVLLAVLFCAIGCINFDYRSESMEVILAYSPVLFTTTYILNILTKRGRWRAVYYFSFFFFIPFLWKENDLGSSVWVVSVVIIQLLYFMVGWQKDNDSFARKGLGYLKAWLFAVILAGIIWLLSISIYLSVSYIFEIWQYEENRFVNYALSFAFAGIMPLLFLMFNQDEQEQREALPLPYRLFDILLNYILTPALLIYAVILYLYFIKITILWSLPKGAVAYIVVCFVSALFILKGCQPFLVRRHFDWFYRFASWMAMPALAMYWVGACYRINQYGFTVDRVYLVVVGLILTGTVLLFLIPRTGRYLYATILSVVLLASVTYIPGVTAKDIERISQSKRGEYPVKTRKFDTEANLQLINKSPLDIDDFRTMQFLRHLKAAETMYYSIQSDTLYIFDDGDMLYREDLNVLLDLQLRKVGLTPGDSLPQDMHAEFFCIDMDSAALVLDEIFVHRPAKDSAYTVSYITPGVYLKKRLPFSPQQK